MFFPNKVRKSTIKACRVLWYPTQAKIGAMGHPAFEWVQVQPGLTVLGHSQSSPFGKLRAGSSGLIDDSP
jgi:hypothetical protein